VPLQHIFHCTRCLSGGLYTIAVRLSPTYESGKSWEGCYRFFVLLYSTQSKIVGWNKRSGSTNRLSKYNKSPLCSRSLTKKSEPCNKNLIAWNRRKKPSCNNDSGWALIADRTLSMSLSCLVEPLRLFHPTRLRSSFRNESVWRMRCWRSMKNPEVYPWCLGFRSECESYLFRDTTKSRCF